MCHACYMAAYPHAAAAAKKAVLDYRRKNKEKCQAYYHNNKKAHWRYHLKRFYGITPEDYNAMLKAQGNKCALCLREVKLHVDHCHTTMKVRGLLCVKCNTSLPLFEDVAWKARAEAYLCP